MQPTHPNQSHGRFFCPAFVLFCISRSLVQLVVTSLVCVFALDTLPLTNKLIKIIVCIHNLHETLLIAFIWAHPTVKSITEMIISRCNRSWIKFALLQQMSNLTSFLFSLFEYNFLAYFHLIFVRVFFQSIEFDSHMIGNAVCLWNPSEIFQHWLAGDVELFHLLHI